MASMLSAQECTADARAGVLAEVAPVLPVSSEARLVAAALAETMRRERSVLIGVVLGDLASSLALRDDDGALSARVVEEALYELASMGVVAYQPGVRLASGEYVHPSLYVHHPAHWRGPYRSPAGEAFAGHPFEAEVGALERAWRQGTDERLAALVSAGLEAALEVEVADLHAEADVLASEVAGRLHEATDAEALSASARAALADPGAS